MKNRNSPTWYSGRGRRGECDPRLAAGSARSAPGEGFLGAAAATAGLRCRLLFPGPGVDPHLMLPVVSLNDPADVSRVQHAGDTVSGVLALLECANDQDLHGPTYLPTRASGPTAALSESCCGIEGAPATNAAGAPSAFTSVRRFPRLCRVARSLMPRRRHREDGEDNQQRQEEQEGQPVGHGTSSGRRSVGADRRTRPAMWSHHPVCVRVFGEERPSRSR
jgi:hypothetical protein